MVQPSRLNELASLLVDEPSVGELLDVDQEYREKAERGELRVIAPRRFNPTREAWLPVLHTQRGLRRGREPECIEFRRCGAPPTDSPHATPDGRRSA
jgi:hypothetical protein